MDVKEKLVEILRKPIFPHELADPIEAVADYLLDSGVTVLPCKIGDEFWTEWVGIRKVRCSMITQKANGSWKGRFTVENSGGASIDITFGNNERELFLTKEEAESYFAQPPKGE